jgi:Phosphate-selective porin O and P
MSYEMHSRHLLVSQVRTLVSLLIFGLTTNVLTCAQAPDGVCIDCTNAEQSVHSKSDEVALGYDRGFFLSQGIARSQIDDAPFLLRVNAWAQLRHSYFNSGGPNPDENQFEFERARLIFSGNAWTPDLQYVLQLDGDNDQATQVDLLDYFVTYDFGHNQLDMAKKRLRLRAGQWKVPYNRARQLSGRELSFADRAMASLMFDINRSVGAGLLGDLELLEIPFSWQVALHNGFNSSAKLPSAATGLDDHLALSGRASLDPLGDWGEEGISDLTWHEAMAIRMGGGFAVSTMDTKQGDEANSLFALDSGETFQTLLPTSVTEFTTSLFSVDLGIRRRGLSLFTEYYFRTTDNFAGVALPQLFDHGFVVQSGYFVVRERLELLAQWSRASGNSSTLGGANRSADEIGFGVGYYINGRNNKLVFDANHVNGAPLRESRLNYQPGDAGWTFRTQLQFGF